ncbi:hypothetical protein PVAND_014983 [Polypedilum vanderplanki]|uniref:Uncharacterized protein n=1 Tax=Polypedilum vanderplanki TaxID=319348 RepID=A0A9J6BAX2_POLVA|nr:hypothetical protein PVAND_014983 [Polypedilum vanderplanki]
MKVLYFYTCYVLILTNLVSSQNSQHIICLFRFNYDNYYSCNVRFANITTDSAPITITGTHLQGKSNDDVVLFETELLAQNPAQINIFHPQILSEFPNLEILYLWDANLMSLNLEHCGKLKEIIIFYNPLEELPNGTFQNCTSLRRLEFFITNTTTYENSFAGLKNLEALALLETPFIEIFNNSLSDLVNLREFSCSTCLTVETESLKNLQNLMTISITRLKYGFAYFQELLNGLTNLITLELSSNNLTDIKFEFFSQFNKLNRLILNNIGINSLPNDAFVNLNSLTYLSLSDNEFLTLNPESFRGLENLSELWLQNCGMEDLSLLPFHHLTNLTYLYIQENPVNTLPSKLFENNKNLESISCWNCKIETIEKNVFDSLPNLSYIHLYGNNLTSIGEEIFVNLPNLFSINLWDNQVKRLNSNSFGVLENLTEFNVRNNGIDEIDPKLFVKFPNLRTFYGSGNDCLSRTVNDIQNIDFEKENIFSTCFYNWQYGRTTTTTESTTTAKEETTANNENDEDEFRPRNWITYTIIAVAIILGTFGFFISLKILIRKRLLWGT